MSFSNLILDAPQDPKSDNLSADIVKLGSSPFPHLTSWSLKLILTPASARLHPPPPQIDHLTLSATLCRRVVFRGHFPLFCQGSVTSGRSALLWDCSLNKHHYWLSVNNVVWINIFNHCVVAHWSQKANIPPLQQNQFKICQSILFANMFWLLSHQASKQALVWGARLWVLNNNL